MRTLIHGGDIVAYDQGGHRLLRAGALVFEGDRITFVGRAYPGPVDQRIDSAGHLVIPGLINIHCHADVEAGGRLVVDCGRRDFFQAGFLNYQGGHVIGVDEAQVLADAQREAERLWAEVPEWHWQKLTADELSPPSFPPLTADLGE